MHLLNVETLKLETFYDKQVPKYAILSHTWGVDEVTFSDIQTPASPTVTGRAGFDKILKTCNQARIDKYKYAWVDTCCIDKSSSAELTEAINSMFKWYRGAGVCYAFLSDVSKAEFDSTFSKSRWFTRGWTLQELIAPDDVVFFDRDWQDLGTKRNHHSLISNITGINVDVLSGVKRSRSPWDDGIEQFSVAQRMSWASGRETTRVEDEAYCLLGIFNINMPMLYGEGSRAFIRLQEEIIRRYDDDSILAWGLDTETRDIKGFVPFTVAEACDEFNIASTDFLASSPKEFKNCKTIESASLSTTPFVVTNLGLQVEMPLVPISNTRSVTHSDGRIYPPVGLVGLLRCSLSNEMAYLGIVLCPTKGDCESATEFRRLKFNRISKHTVIIGPRATTIATTKKITIVRHDKNRNVREHRHRKGRRHYVITESQALIDMGYRVHQVSYGDVCDRAWLSKPDAQWNPIAMVLSVDGKVHNQKDILRFTFKTQQGGPDAVFSISMRDPHAYLQEPQGAKSGASSDTYTEVLYPSVSKTTPKDSEGKYYRILVTAKKKEVHSDVIVEVHVGVVSPDDEAL